jgi:hypothetical protein
MARPRTPKLGTKPKARPQPGTIVLEPPSGKDILNDLKSGLVPLLKLCFAFLKGTVKGTFRTLLADPSGPLQAGAEIGKDAVDSLLAFGKTRGERDSLGRRFWTLTANSLLEAISYLIDQHGDHLQISESDRFELQFDAQERLASDVVITRAVLSRPDQILRDISLESYLLRMFSTTFRTGEKKAPYFLSELYRAFDNAFWLTLQSDSGYYGLVTAHLNSPHAQWAKWATAEQEHRSRLRNLANQPVLGATFILRDIFIDLRAARWSDPAPTSKHGSFDIFLSTTALLDWAKRPPSINNDLVQFVSGGPGTGKSSLAYMVLSDLSDHDGVFPILIRLLDFKWDVAGFESALARYIEKHYPYLPYVPWGKETSEYFHKKSILLVFDGLDELTKALGTRGETQSRALVESFLEFAEQKSAELHKHSSCLRGIILGRTASVQELRQGKLEKFDRREIILLDLGPDPAKRQPWPAGCAISDPKNILRNDQRPTWWANYAIAAPDVSVLPEIYRDESLVELTREPLTLFLLAFSNYHDAKRRKNGPTANIAQVYRDIFIGVYERDVGRGAHAGQMALNFSEFFRATQVIGFSAWFSTERSTTRAQLTETIEKFVPKD